MRPEQYNLWIQKRDMLQRGTWRWFFGSIGDDCYIYILFGETIDRVLVRHERPQKWLPCYKSDVTLSVLTQNYTIIK